MCISELEREFFAASSKDVTNGFKEICFISKQEKGKGGEKKKLLSRKTRFSVSIQTAAKNILTIRLSLGHGRIH